MRKEVARDFGVVGVVETHGPADHVQLVVSARTDRIGAVFDEQLDDGEIAALGGKVNRERVVSLIADVRVGAAIEQRSSRPLRGRRRSAAPSEVPCWLVTFRVG